MLEVIKNKWKATFKKFSNHHDGWRAGFNLYLVVHVCLSICLSYATTIAVIARIAVDLGLISPSAAVGSSILLIIIGLFAFQACSFFQRVEDFILSITRSIDSAIDFFKPYILPTIYNSNLSIFFPKIYSSHISRVPVTPPRHLA